MKYGFDGLLGTTGGAVDNSMDANQGSRDGVWFSEVTLHPITN